MAGTAKTIVATGASSGLGFELVKQLLQQTQPYKFILGARDTRRAQAAYDKLKYDAARHTVTILPLELSNLKNVRTFASQTLNELGPDRLDYLLLNAAITNPSVGPGPNGSKWCESLVVNHLSQHYLIHLLREKLVDSRARIVVVSSGAVRSIRDQDPRTLDIDLKAGAGVPGGVVYCASKFTQLLGAHWWRRELQGACTVVAVSPGLIPDTGIGRGSGMRMTMDMPDAKTVSEGAQSILRAFTRNDFPADPEQIFLTSWGEWWPKDVYGLSLDKNLQEKWSFGKGQIEKEAGLFTDQRCHK